MVVSTVLSGYSHISEHNSYTYKGYRYDTDLSMYYLNSRYYNPEIGRFINSDGLMGKTGDWIGMVFKQWLTNPPYA
ncbi:MAG: hypothetical protein KAU02_04275 [Tenericutes bacterium]|nr:hypothetical protein [Mycoplasmatota bacterium]